jgi:hypothetical protein
MSRNWIVRGICLALAMVTLSGCIVVPGHHHRPVYYSR